MSNFSVHYDPEGMAELIRMSPFNLRKDLKDISEEEIQFISQEIADELHSGIHRPPNTIRRYLSREKDAAWVKVKVVDVKRDAGKSNGYRCVTLVDLKNQRAYLLHIYRHGHGEDRDISRTAENQLKNMVDEYSQALKN